MAIENPGNATQRTQALHGDASESDAQATFRNQFQGAQYLDPQACYKEEHAGECAARLVQERVAHLSGWVAVAAIGQIVVGLITSGIIFLQLRATQVAAKAAQTAAEAATHGNELNREVFTSSERPWVAVSAVPLGVRYDINGMNVSLRCLLKNTGHSPASRVSLHAEMCEREADPLPRHERIAKEMRLRPKEAGFATVIFPGEVAVFDVTITTASQQLSEFTKQMGCFFPTIFGCVAYTFVFDDSVHQTGFIFDLSRRDGYFSPTFPGEGNIVAEDLVLRQLIFGMGVD